MGTKEIPYSRLNLEVLLESCINISILELF